EIRGRSDQAEHGGFAGARFRNGSGQGRSVFVAIAAAVSAASFGETQAARLPLQANCYSGLSRVIIDLNAARLSLLPLPRNLANVLCRGNARAGTARHRARDRLGVSATHQFAP